MKILAFESTCDETECNHPTNCDLCQATRLYNAGYRKRGENVIELPCKVGTTLYFLYKLMVSVDNPQL